MRSFGVTAGWLRAAAALCAVVCLIAAGCSRNTGLPAPDSKEYRDLVSAFYVGLAGLQTGEDVRAKAKLTLAAQIAPGEPATWANLGLLAVRQQEFDIAFANVDKARTLAPENSRIEALLGLIESRRGRLPDAIAHLKKAVTLDRGNLKALYALAQETERQAAPDSDAQRSFSPKSSSGSLATSPHCWMWRGWRPNSGTARHCKRRSRRLRRNPPRGRMKCGSGSPRCNRRRRATHGWPPCRWLSCGTCWHAYPCTVRVWMPSRPPRCS